jgi:predicted 2-oxoglutarate/Fe(II)-dependent dioxygenase YbiX
MFIEEFPNAVSLELCEGIIARFDNDPAQGPSVVIVDGVAKTKNIRSGVQLAPNAASGDWRGVYETLAPALRATMKAYAAKYPGLAVLAATEGLECTPPLIERVEPGQGFDWHSDQSAARPERVVAGLLYLRTVATGGHTEFAHQGQAVQPEAGKIVLFPPFWTHHHRGATPESGSKYVLSFFWIYRRKS